MSSRVRSVLALFWVITASGVWSGNDPHIGYVFPAGGQQGSSFQMMIGGQYLQGATNVFVTGEGVHAEIERYTIKHEPKRLRQLYRSLENAKAAVEGKEDKTLEKELKRIEQAEKQIMLTELPEGIDPLNKKKVFPFYRDNTREQFNPQIADRLRVKLSIAANASPGERELRVYTASGLSNPIYFQVGTLDEVREIEPNDDHMNPELQTISIPAVINGNIDPGDMDHFRFPAEKGQSIVVDVGARKIIPYLADAVPGWFQAVVSLYDEDGNEVAYRDDYKFNPDPVLFFDVPESGNYTLSIKDAIYRGREDFIYRIAIGELPFITSIFPLGSQQGRPVDISLMGKNLPKNRISGKLPSTEGEVRHVSISRSGYRSNQMPFAISNLPEAFESEPNDTKENAQSIQQPMIINGKIQQASDRDVFSFSGSKGDTLVLEVLARRLHSPLDSVLVLTGPGIPEPVRVDDCENSAGHLFLGAGLVTHHADSYLLYELPGTGDYHVTISDNQGKGGPDYGYRLRISPAQPDFTLRMQPSGLRIAPGGTAAFTIRAMRMDGFDQEIKLSGHELPPGFTMSDVAIHANSDTAHFTITAPKEFEQKMISPEIVGTGLVGGRPVRRTAVPVDDTMQAFLYRHLVPAQELVLAPQEQQAAISFEVKVPPSGILKIPLGKEVRIPLNGRFRGVNGAKLKLDGAPEGLTLVKGWLGRNKAKGKTADGKPKYEKNVAVGAIVLKAEKPLEPGFSSSLVVLAEVRKGRETSLYPAPAVNIKIVAPEE